jgi:hypothetical protein
MNECVNNQPEKTMDNVTINGIEYAPVKKNEGTRAVVVVDRGWIFAGDVERKNGRIYLARAVWVFKWESIGFAGVIADPSKADIRRITDIELPDLSEIFSIPVHDSWGLA